MSEFSSQPGYLGPGVSDTVLLDYRKYFTDPLDLLSTRD